MFTVGDTVTFRVSGRSRSRYGIITYCWTHETLYNIQETNGLFDPTGFGTVSYVSERYMQICPIPTGTQTHNTDDAWDRAMKGV